MVTYLSIIIVLGFIVWTSIAADVINNQGVYPNNRLYVTLNLLGTTLFLIILAHSELPSMVQIWNWLDAILPPSSVHSYAVWTLHSVLVLIVGIALLMLPNIIIISVKKNFR